ncbi:type IV pilus modification protein PilV [Ferrimonas senticii]|uniref:type IV pilus modification protein PilV n=1 Tax=Ferrimonas senticii TaxID=394566 RepID=UPI000412C417|nr:type IV pilus modification protein PilV [Ferrimonas senticii]
MPKPVAAIAPKQQGFTLIELLIAVLVVAIGLLGFARMQVSSLQNAREVRFSQQAYSAALDLSERIRAEPRAAINSDFNFTNLATGTMAAVTDCQAAATTCTRAQFAEYELFEWFQSARQVIPQLRFAVLQPETNLIRLQLTWDATLTGTGTDFAGCAVDGQSHQCVEMELWIRE